MERGEKLIEEDKHTRLELTSQTLQNITRFFDDLNWYSENEVAAINFWRNYLQIVDKELIQDIKEMLESSEINIPEVHHDTFVLVCNEFIIYQQCFWNQMNEAGIELENKSDEYMKHFINRFAIFEQSLPEINIDKEISKALPFIEEIRNALQVVRNNFQPPNTEIDSNNKSETIKLSLVITEKTKSKTIAIPEIDKSINYKILEFIESEFEKFEIQKSKDKVNTQIKNRFRYRANQLLKFTKSILPSMEDRDISYLLGKLFQLTGYKLLHKKTRKGICDIFIAEVLQEN